MPPLQHMGLFVPTILGQASPDQQSWWLFRCRASLLAVAVTPIVSHPPQLLVARALNFEMVGSYAQTECVCLLLALAGRRLQPTLTSPHCLYRLGHGSNVRGLRTTAEYDPATQEFVLNTPTLQSMKWWNSNIGLAATHAAVYAQLIIKGKEYGVHVFMLQIRDEHHKELPGIEAGGASCALFVSSLSLAFVPLCLRVGVPVCPSAEVFPNRLWLSLFALCFGMGRACRRLWCEAWRQRHRHWLPSPEGRPHPS